MEELKVNGTLLKLALGDITTQEVDAVVNAANERLAPGGGVAGAIHKAAGPELWRECQGLGGCQVGEAKLSAGYNLPNKFVIHTVGPVYSGRPADADHLRSCYKASLELADKYGIKSVAFPAISTGIFGYPVAAAARVALDAIMAYLCATTGLELVIMVLHDEGALRAHENAIKEMKCKYSL